MLMSSGAMFGFKRSVPHILGVFVGYNFLLIAAIFGLGAVLSQFPWSLIIIKVCGSAWLSWMGFKFLRSAFQVDKPETSSKADDIEKAPSRPFKFYEAALFQWVNPKGLIMATLTAGAYVGIADDILLRTFLMCGTFLVAGCVSASTWTIAGSWLNRLMSSGKSARILNTVMGILLIGTALMILMAKVKTG